MSDSSSFHTHQHAPCVLDRPVLEKSNTNLNMAALKASNVLDVGRNNPSTSPSGSPLAATRRIGCLKGTRAASSDSALSFVYRLSSSQMSPSNSNSAPARRSASSPWSRQPSTERGGENRKTAVQKARAMRALSNFQSESSPALTVANTSSMAPASMLDRDVHAAMEKLRLETSSFRITKEAKVKKCESVFGPSIGSFDRWMLFAICSMYTSVVIHVLCAAANQ
eukprot:2588263-Rhodomonas_salina.1